MAKLGYTFRIAREAQGISLAHVERATKINRSYLIALEADAFDDLPGPFYTNNLIRQYALFLDLPAERILRLYPGRDTRAPMDPLNKLLSPGSGWGVWLLVAGVVVLMVTLAYGLIEAEAEADGGSALSAPVIVLAPSTPAPTEAPAPVQAPAPPATPAPTPRPRTAPATPALVTVAVPDVISLDVAAAEANLSAAGFTVSRQEAWSDVVAVGLVIEQNPPAGAERGPGDEVIVVVSRGRQGTFVPDVIGLGEAEARAQLEAAGLAVGPYVNRQGRDQLPDRVRESVCVGCVLSTIPGRGVAVEPGTVIALAVRAE